jgi:chromosome segregation ATPase
MEEKKTYPTSEVTITTEEYRDLITEAAENRKEAEVERNNRWRYETELKALKEEYAEIKAENKKLINEMAKIEVELTLAERKISELESELRQCIYPDEEVNENVCS